MIPRILATPAAAARVRTLVAQHGPLLFHQSGGCCEGSAPMCFKQDEFRVGSRDVLLGEIEGCPVYISGPQFEAWANSQLTIDLVEGGGDSFSLEAPDGVRFLTRSRQFTPEEFGEVSPALPQDHHRR